MTLKQIMTGLTSLTVFYFASSLESEAKDRFTSTPQDCRVLLAELGSLSHTTRAESPELAHLFANPEILRTVESSGDPAPKVFKNFGVKGAVFTVKGRRPIQEFLARLRDKADEANGEEPIEEQLTVSARSANLAQPEGPKVVDADVVALSQEVSKGRSRAEIVQGYAAIAVGLIGIFGLSPDITNPHLKEIGDAFSLLLTGAGVGLIVRNLHRQAHAALKPKTSIDMRAWARPEPSVFQQLFAELTIPGGLPQVHYFSHKLKWDEIASNLRRSNAARLRLNGNCDVRGFFVLAENEGEPVLYLLVDVR